MRIIEVNNITQREGFLNLPSMSLEQARSICAEINRNFPTDYPIIWRVVKDNHDLRTEFLYGGPIVQNAGLGEFQDHA